LRTRFSEISSQGCLEIRALQLVRRHLGGGIPGLKSETWGNHHAEPSALFISVLSLGELRKGVALKTRLDADAAKRLGTWVDGFHFSFGERILGVVAAIAGQWGELTAQRSRRVVDTLLPATALVHKLTLVTRNINDMHDLGVNLLDPWRE
jgi:predicted nucleic acid-binding protein